MDFAEYKRRLSAFIPEKALLPTYRWWQDEPFKLVIAKPRKSKLGDFRVKTGRDCPTISINRDLNPYAFLITLAHEYAHLLDFKSRRSLKNPHGRFWKTHYSKLLRELSDEGVFPDDILPALVKHIEAPSASSCADPHLLRALNLYNTASSSAVYLEELPEGADFTLENGRVFIKGKRRRTRYRCRELTTGKHYLIHHLAQVNAK
ncbi:MAG: hypothetical protein Kow0075_00780 [Salibacteraceae bacterium]